jgi:hypothetical protein
MNDAILKTIGQSKDEREVLQSFLLSELEKQAGRDAVQGKDTTGYKEARQCIVKSLDTLVTLYSEKKTKEIVHSSI